MTFVSVAQAAHRLGIDAKTLHRWLAQAQLALHPHPADGRKQGVSEQHLQVLARLHQRSLPALPEQAPPPQAGAPPELLAVCEQLTTVQAQLLALREQVADLSHLLAQHAHPPVGPAAQAPPSTPRKCPPRLLLPVLVGPPRLLPPRPASRPMSSRAWSMSRRDAMW